MVNGEQTLNAPRSLSWSNKLCRSIMLRIFASLPQGQLVIKENGVFVDAFGERDSDLHAEIDIHDMSTYKKLLFGGSVASGETYTDGSWTTPNLTNVIRIFARNLDMLDAWESKMEWLALPIRKIRHLANKNSQTGAKKNISAHYDLGNKLYTRFLDNSMMYSSAIYPAADASLAEAQDYKLRVICEKLQLNESDHLLEIGTGWGGLAIYAAKHYGCRVTTTTISDEQHAYASQWIAREGLQNKITLLKEDYRLLEGQYDKLVSIEMIEAVGKEYLPTFFKKCSSLLKNHGVMLLQAITINDQRLESYSKNVDFIQKHIFPGGYLPSHLLINQHLKSHTDMMIRDLHDIGLDYAKTLQDWHQQLLENKEVLATEGYDERFMKMWRYYFSYCEGGFLERTISTVQLVLSKPAYSAALTR
ncbi:cyclopropane-fatty-acyl-phospholipid synthase family protein [Aliiglaciecola sp. LCG003]|uniref:SAM-dependent methyltransferase n=1 Tax=Aliiglaciecola sp. LCG003 TaxID=3053655 RepID=UPI002572D2B3|nr:cyclopropane-fatty-acyl-phospholipid synthase family protein [Aliiglaciecola sp. LCG003]WJG09956.1 cyclopropane-fatty-acyl-phospholipid synthase family protein [Aliiglaciecola sp. LCG003]